MQRPILTYPDPLLTKKAEPVTEITDAIRSLAADMLETMYTNEGIGLAAPQVGENIRLIVIDLSGPEERSDPQVFVNPQLSPLDPNELVDSEEGCLSVPKYRSVVKRYPSIKFSALDLENNPVEFEANEIMAICLQHECDHLEGTLFLDHLSRLKRNMYDAKVKKWAKKEEE